MNRLRPSLLLLAASVLAAAAHAQIVSVYVLSANTHASNVPTGTTYTNSGYTTQYTSFMTSGIGGGLTFNFLPIGPVKLGMDFRGSTKSGVNGIDTGMAGPRIAIKIPFVKLKPFVEAAGGYMETRNTNISTTSASSGPVGGTYTSQYAAYEIIGGVDYSIFPFIDLRVEGGGGKGYTVSSLALNNPATLNTISVYHISPGIVVHF